MVEILETEMSEYKNELEELHVIRMNALTQARGLLQILNYGVPVEKRNTKDLFAMANKCEKYVLNGLDEQGNVVMGD